MNRALAYRGPDDEGIYEDTEVTLGHRLLSIRDTSPRARQPFTEAHCPWVLMLDGEIYNTDTVKTHLPATYSTCRLDTALIFGLIKRFGWRFIDYIEGMFSIVIYNTEEQQIRLYRDASGQKNLYYYHHPTHFTFSSELHSLLKNPQVVKSTDTEAVALFCQIGYLPGAKTLIKNVRKVNPAEIVVCDLRTNEIYTTNFAHKTSFDYTHSFDAVAEELVAQHTQAETGFSLNLSGGIDSTFWLYQLSKQGIPVTTFTTSFDTSHQLADSVLAKRLTAEMGIQHHEILVTDKEYNANLIKSYEVIEEPNCSFSIPVYYEMAAQHKIRMPSNRVIFSGDGGDEIFGGYEHYLTASRYEYTNSDPLSHPGIYYNYYQSPYVDQSFLNNHQDCLSARTYVTQAINDCIFDVNTSLKPILLAMKIDRLIWLAGQTFIRNDKTYLHQGLEIRNPLIYGPFQNYIDGTFRDGDYITERENKVFLRNYLHDKVPDYISTRTEKTGWDAPIQHVYGPRTREIFQSILSEAALRHSQQLNWSRASELVHTHTTWPGRAVQGMISLAIVANYLDIDL